MAQSSETSVKSVRSSELTDPATRQDAKIVAEPARGDASPANSKYKSEGDVLSKLEPSEVAKHAAAASSVASGEPREDSSGCRAESNGGACCSGSGQTCERTTNDNADDSSDVRRRDLPVTQVGQLNDCQCPVERGEGNNAVSVNIHAGPSAERNDSASDVLDLQPASGEDRHGDNNVITSAATDTHCAATSSPKPADGRRIESLPKGNVGSTLRPGEQPQANLLASNGSCGGGQEDNDASKPKEGNDLATDNRTQHGLEGKSGASDHTMFNEQCTSTSATAASSSSSSSIGADVPNHPQDLQISTADVQHDCTIVAGNVGVEEIRRSISQTGTRDTAKHHADAERTSVSQHSAGESERCGTPADKKTSMEIPYIVISPCDFQSILHEPTKSAPSPAATSESAVELKTFHKKTTTAAVIPRTQNRDEPVLTHYKRRSDDDSVFYPDAAASHTPRHSDSESGGGRGSTSSVHFDEPSSRIQYMDVHGAAGHSLGERRKSSDYCYSLHAEAELRPKKGRSGRRHGDREDRSGVSVTGIHVVVETPKKRSKYKPMVKLQSPRLQCCLCGCTVFSMMFGMFMLSAGVCLLLNYNFLEVDTSGLPPDLHNDEGKKVVGIILISVGIAAMVIGGLISFLYFCNSSCSLGSSANRSADAGGAAGGSKAENGVAGQGHRNGGHHHLNGATQGRASPALSGSGGRRHAGSQPNLRRGVPDPRHRGTPGSSASLKDVPTSAYSRSGAAAAAAAAGKNGTPPSAIRSHGQKSRHGAKVKGRHGRYKNPLAPHPEEAGGDTQSLSDSRKSAHSMRRQLFTEKAARENEDGGYVNKGAILDDEDVQRSGTRDSVSSGSSFTPSVIIKVDTTHVVDEEEDSEERDRGEIPDVDSGETVVTSTPYKHPQISHSQHPGDTVTFSLTGEQVENDTGAPLSSQHPGFVNEVTFDTDDDTGRLSRSTVDSSDTLDETMKDADPSKRLDNQINSLLL